METDLADLRRAMEHLAAAREAFALAETWGASGLIDPRAAHRAVREAARELIQAENELRGVADELPTRVDERAWGAH